MNVACWYLLGLFGGGALFLPRGYGARERALLAAAWFTLAAGAALRGRWGVVVFAGAIGAFRVWGAFKARRTEESW